METRERAQLGVAVFDANDLHLRGTQAALEADPRFTVTLATRDLRPESLAELPSGADVALVDPIVQGQPAHDSLRLILANIPVVVVYTDFFEPQFFLGVMLAKVRGYLSKADTDGERLRGLLWSVIKHRIMAIDSRLADYFWASPAERVVLFAPSGNLEALTPRERQIMELLASGLTDGEIALRFGVSLSTVQSHVQNVERKLGARSRFDLAMRAVHRGIINPSARFS